MSNVMPYDPEFYARLGQSSASSAAVIVPLLKTWVSATSVLDVGCGDGSWLAIYSQMGAETVRGVEIGRPGDHLQISPDHVVHHDLTGPLDLGRRFDLVQCLEVAEHLPAESAETLIDSLCRHADVILFSAAIPHQGGVGHVNERWPDEWATLFATRGYICFDCLRPLVWADDRVAWWYAQNLLLFVRSGVDIHKLPPPISVGPHLRLVHPTRYLAISSSPDLHQIRSHPTKAEKPFDVAVVIPTVLRPTLNLAVTSIFAQRFSGSIQILIGVDVRRGDPTLLTRLAAAAPAHITITILDLGYSTAARHGGHYAASTGGALRTILSYAAHSQWVAYLDDDNWWGPDHLLSLRQAVDGHHWAYSLRWYADAQTSRPLCVDRWESMGPDAGVFRDRFGGFVDPSCLLIDKIACEPVLRLWATALSQDTTGMSSDRPVFAWLRQHGHGVGTQRATAYYTLGPGDSLHAQRLSWIAQTREDLFPQSVDPQNVVGNR